MEKDVKFKLLVKLLESPEKQNFLKFLYKYNPLLEEKNVTLVGHLLPKYHDDPKVFHQECDRIFPTMYATLLSEEFDANRLIVTDKYQHLF